MQYNKQINFLLIFALISFAGFAQDSGYRLTATLKGLKPEARAWLVYEYGMTDQKTLDSADLRNGAFTFLGIAGDPLVKASLVIARDGGGVPAYNTHPDARVVYLEKGNVGLTGNDSIRTATVGSGPVNADYADYDAAVLSWMRLTEDRFNAVYKDASPQQQQDSAFRARLFGQFKAVMKIQDSLSVAWIQRHPGSYLSLITLGEVAGKNIDVSRILPLFNGLSDSLRTTSQGRAFAAAIESARVTSIGSIAPDFTENDPDDHPIKLSDFRGKYVLLDFWASWCGPCRAENPNVVRAYAKYKDKNFTVLSVSLDGPGKKDAWLGAVKKDGLGWTQVSDLKFWNNAAAKLYAIRSIPQNFLIDPTGKIVGRNLRGEDLERRLAELL